MFGFLTFGTTLALTDLAVKKEIEARPDEEFPKTVKESEEFFRKKKFLSRKRSNSGSRIENSARLCEKSMTEPDNRKKQYSKN